MGSHGLYGITEAKGINVSKGAVIGKMLDKCSVHLKQVQSIPRAMQGVPSACCIACVAVVALFSSRMAETV